MKKLIFSPFPLTLLNSCFQENNGVFVIDVYTDEADEPYFEGIEHIRCGWVRGLVRDVFFRIIFGLNSVCSFYETIFCLAPSNVSIFHT